MKKGLIDLLKNNGFAEVSHKPESNGIMLHRAWYKEIETECCYKKYTCYSVNVYVVEDTGRCNVTYYMDDYVINSHFYGTIGRRTFNSIIKTIKCDGYEM